jgi:hypothetical protein
MWYAVMGGWCETCSEIRVAGLLAPAVVGYVPKNNSPRIGFRGFFSFFDYKLVM